MEPSTALRDILPTALMPQPVGSSTSTASRDEAQIRDWREHYRQYLVANKIPAAQAADLAERVAYRPDLYPAIATNAAVPSTPSSPAARRPSLLRAAKLIAAGAAIDSTPPTGDDMAFTHAVLCQVGLPRTRVEGRDFRRQSGTMWINLQAGLLDEGYGPVEQPIPYGPMPRLALAWISTLAKRHKSREVAIGETAADFLRMLGMDVQGGRYATLRKQMHALAACRLQLGHNGRTFNGQAVEQFDAWTPTNNDRQRSIWPGVVVLSEAYYKELVDHGVPLDNRALTALRGSSLALDIYTWLAHRLHRIPGRPALLHWKAIREQFAQEYQGKDADKDFRKSFLHGLQAARTVYPKAQVEAVRGGLLLRQSPPPIPYRA